MDGLSRRSRFEARISTEREFLTVINAVLGDYVPLAGMTHAAIKLWGERVGTKFRARQRAEDHSLDCLRVAPPENPAQALRGDTEHEYVALIAALFYQCCSATEPAVRLVVYRTFHIKVRHFSNDPSQLQV